jgi:DNA-binding NtrC family response regulator
LPRVRDIEECVRPEESSTERAPGKETILIVEDEDIVRQLACEALTMLGYHTLTAANPAEAIDISATYAGRIHLLLTDVVLPQMDGRSLFKKISAIRPDIKVLFASGYTENFIVHHGVLDKDLHFLQKPFNIDNLVRKVRIAIDSPK